MSKESRKKVYRVPKDNRIILIDFGGSVFWEERDTYLINTRQYRSPEVILGCEKWDYASDVWSIGCILMELYTGELFFPTHNSIEHLMMIQKACGKLPKWMMTNSRSEIYEHYDDLTKEFCIDKLAKRKEIELNLLKFENFDVLL